MRSTVRSARCRSMADYELEGPKPARMYEVILPKKLGYFGKVQEVLEDLFDEDAIRAVPFVRKSIAEARRHDPTFDEEAGSRRSAGPRAATRSTRWTADTSRRRGRSTSGCWSSGSSSTTPAATADPEDRLPGRVARSGQPPGRPPLRRRAGRRGGDLVPGISSARSWRSGAETGRTSSADLA